LTFEELEHVLFDSLKLVHVQPDGKQVCSTYKLLIVVMQHVV